MVESLIRDLFMRSRLLFDLYIIFIVKKLELVQLLRNHKEVERTTNPLLFIF